MEVKTIAVIGAGATGRAIAYASALGGCGTILEDISPPMLAEAIAYICKELEDGVSRGELTPGQREAALTNLATAHSVEDACRRADLLIETVPEEMEMKLEIFTIFDKFAKPHAILATNSSSLSITEIASITFRTENCIGMRFHGAGQEIKLIEIVLGLESSDATVAACVEVGRRLGKEVAVMHDLEHIIDSEGGPR